MFLVHSRNFNITFRIRESIRTLFLTSSHSDEHGNANDSKARAAKKLNSLLKSIIQDDNIEREPEKVAATKFKKITYFKPEKQKNIGEKIVEAAKQVADTIKDDPERTEAELLHKLLYKNEHLQKSILKATKNKTLSELISGMEVEKMPKTKKQEIRDAEYSRADQVRSLLKGKTTQKRTSYPRWPDVSIDLFGSKPLGIFTSKSDTTDAEEEQVKLETWERCRERELKLSITHPPTNIFEEMIIWTDRGMLWKFPIDNEQGLEEEKKISFAEHVFLETHLEDWCPNRGPIRHFMELVCVGLSRNHWLSAEEKKAHILWYKDYFLQKKKLIQELGAGDLKQPTAIADT